MVGSKNLHPDCLESLRPRGHVIHAAGVAACRIYSTIGRGPTQASGACGYAPPSWLEVLRGKAIGAAGAAWRRAFPSGPLGGDCIECPQIFCRDSSYGYTWTIQPKIEGIKVPPASAQASGVEIEPPRPNLVQSALGRWSFAGMQRLTCKCQLATLSGTRAFN